MSADPALNETARLPADDLRWILDRLPGGVIAVDRDRRVRYFNLAARQLVHPALLRVGFPLPDVPSEPPLHELVDRLVEHGLVTEQETKVPGDRTFILYGRFHRSRELAVLHFVDVSARSRRRRAGEDFVVNAAHEFLSPLTAIAGAAHVLSEGADANPEVRERFLRHITEATARLIAISRALLVLARAEAGLEPPRLDLVPIRPLLDEVEAACIRELSVSCPDGVIALTDRDLLRQALSTIVDNASRHSTGKVAVSVADRPERIVRIEIADSGSGILPEHLDRVTQRFFSGTGRDSEGFGIGLSIAARSLNAAGGSLSVDSTREGTRAVVEIPTAR